MHNLVIESIAVITAIVYLILAAKEDLNRLFCTYFPKYKININPKQIGVATLHPGNITHKHGARPVTKGTRYVVVSFIKGAGHK